jgi:putative ABC transport system permease protein
MSISTRSGRARRIASTASAPSAASATTSMPSAMRTTPRQTVVVVVTSVAMTGLIGGGVGMPLGVALNGWIMPAMGHSAGLNLPESVIAVYRTTELILLALGGLLIAVLGALLPAGWAARTRGAVALRTE